MKLVLVTMHSLTTVITSPPHLTLLLPRDRCPTGRISPAFSSTCTLEMASHETKQNLSFFSTEVARNWDKNAFIGKVNQCFGARPLFTLSLGSPRSATTTST